MTHVAAAGGFDGVLLDYGNTLVTMQRPEAALERAYDRITARLRGRGLSPPAAAILLRDVHDRVEQELVDHVRSGNLEEIDLVAASRRAYADLGLELEPAVLDEMLDVEQLAWWEGVRLDPEAVPLIEALHARGLRVGLCSNAPFRIRSMHAQLRHVGLTGHLDSVTFSAEVGWRKPSPRMFAAALEALGTVATHTVMVGDSVGDDIEGALAAGLTPIRLLRDGGRAHDPAPPGVTTVGSLRDVPAAIQALAVTYAEWNPWL